MERKCLHLNARKRKLSIDFLLRVSESCINQDVESEINDLLTEAMILLDPPKIGTGTLSLSRQDVIEAHDILLLAARKSNKIIETTFGKDNNEEKIVLDHLNLNQPWKKHGEVKRRSKLSTEEKSISLVVDVYRALILACHLILESSTWRNEKEKGIYLQNCLCDSSLSFNDTKELFRNIRKSVLILQYLSFICYAGKEIGSNYEGDWHENYLPISQHPLLQECFHKNHILNAEDGIIIGQTNRLISLNIDDYLLENYMNNVVIHSNGIHLPTFQKKTTDVSLQNKNEDLRTYCSSANSEFFFDKDYVQLQCEVRSDHVIEYLPKNIESNQLKKEENQLIKIAFPESRSSKVNHKNSGVLNLNIKKRYLGKPLIEKAKDIGIVPLLWNKYKSSTCLIAKKGCLNMIIVNAANDSIDIEESARKDNQRKHKFIITLLTNGTIIAEVLRNPNNDVEDNMMMDIAFVFTLTGLSHCQPLKGNNSFNFTITDIEKWYQSEVIVNDLIEVKHDRIMKDSLKVGRVPNTSSLIFEVDEFGGGLVDGYSWITSVSKYINFLNRKDACRAKIIEEWAECAYHKGASIL